MRPARNALRPAMHASRIAWAIVSGSRAPAMPVFKRTPSQPSSIAKLTSLAVPTPASTITGYSGSLSFRYSRQMRMLFGFRTPCPLPIGLPAGMTEVGAGLLQPPGGHGIVRRIAEDLELVLHELLGRLKRGDRIGEQGFFVPEDFQLDPVSSRIFEAQQNLAAETGDANGIIRRETAGRVG